MSDIAAVKNSRTLNGVVYCLDQDARWEVSPPGPYDPTSPNFRPLVDVPETIDQPSAFTEAGINTVSYTANEYVTEARPRSRSTPDGAEIALFRAKNPTVWYD